MGPKFKSKLNKMQKDWEKFLFWVLLLVVFGFFINFIVQVVFFKDPTPELNVTGSSQKSIFGDNAFAFLYGVPLLEEDESPFNLKKSFPKIKKHTWHKPKNDKPKPKPKPKPIKQGRCILFSGWINVASGEKVAFIKVFDLRSKKLLKSDTVKIGNTINKFTLKKIEDKKIIIEEDDGRTREVPIYQQITIMEK